MGMESDASESNMSKSSVGQGSGRTKLFKVGTELTSRTPTQNMKSFAKRLFQRQDPDREPVKVNSEFTRFKRGDEPYFNETAWVCGTR
jgi:hypothetical protein